MFIGLYNYTKNYLYKILRAEATPHKIALAVAIGFFVACFIPVGGHTVIVILLAFVFRVDRIIAFLATWIANPYTIPLMYPGFCFIGSKIIRAGLSFSHINKELTHIFSNFKWHDVFTLGKELLVSYLVGGFVCGIIIACIGYFIFYKLVNSYQRTQLSRKKAKNEK
jgi:uncharacterized protein